MLLRTEVTHATDLDFLLAAKHPGGNTRVDAVGEVDIPLSQCLDDRCGVDSRCGPESVTASERVVIGHRNPRRPGRRFDIVDQSAHIVRPVAS